jgi:hypothetical protein
MWGYRYNNFGNKNIKPQLNIAPIILFIPVSIAIIVPMFIYATFFAYITYWMQPETEQEAQEMSIVEEQPAKPQITPPD